jgi:membrane protein
VRVRLEEIAPGESDEEKTTGRPRSTGKWKS